MNFHRVLMKTYQVGQNDAAFRNLNGQFGILIPCAIVNYLNMRRIKGSHPEGELQFLQESG